MHHGCTICLMCTVLDVRCAQCRHLPNKFEIDKLHVSSNRNFPQLPKSKQEVALKYSFVSALLV